MEDKNFIVLDHRTKTFADCLTFEEACKIVLQDGLIDKNDVEWAIEECGRFDVDNFTIIGTEA